MSLSAKQQRFVEEYLLDFNGAAAARRAGYSERTAREQAARLLTKVNVAAAVEAALDQQSAESNRSAQRILKELARIAFLDPRKVFTWGPQGVTVLDSATLDPDVAACVAEASQTVTEGGGTIRIKLSDKLQALQMLGRRLGLFVDRTEHVFPEGLPVTPEQADQARQKVEAYRQQRRQNGDGHTQNSNGTPG